MVEKRDRKKENILKALKSFGNIGKLPTYRIAAICGLSSKQALPVLKALESEKKIKMFKETLATYWELR